MFVPHLDPLLWGSRDYRSVEEAAMPTFVFQKVGFVALTDSLIEERARDQVGCYCSAAI